MKILVKIFWIFVLTGYYIKQLTVANLRVALEVVTLPLKMSPAIIGIDLDIKSEAGIFVLVNLITMTPGTFTLDLSQDKKKIYVHVMYAANVNEAKAEIKYLEKQIMKITGK